MGFLGRFLGNGDKDTNLPGIKFGRYSDSYKTERQYDAWDRALDKFEKKDFQGSFAEFMAYLKDEGEQNVSYKMENDRLLFEIFQGSKKVTGYADHKKLKAEVKVARVNELNIGFMRRIMEQNFGLKYARYALDQNGDIVMVFDTSILDGSPYKLYYALKEIATSSDKTDDLLLEEFDTLTPIDAIHLDELDESEKATKLEYIRNSVQSVLTEIEEGKLDQNQYPGAIGYLLLDLIYRLDYLIRPEGFMMETLERCHRQYFAKDGKSQVQKIQALKKKVLELAERTDEEFYKEFYDVSSTFGITTPVNHDRVMGFIDGELGNMDWYKKNKHYKIAMSIPGYIVGYCLFNYAVPKPDKDYFHLYYQIVEQPFFNQLGFKLTYIDPVENVLNKKAIKKAIDQIRNNNSAVFPKLNPNTNLLNFNDLVSFAQSFMIMIREFDLTKSPAG